VSQTTKQDGCLLGFLFNFSAKFSFYLLLIELFYFAYRVILIN